MDEGFRLFPEQASENASQVDALFWYVAGVDAFFIAAICALVLFFVVRYRRASRVDRRNPHQTSTAIEVAWSVPPLLLSISMFAWGAKLYFDRYNPPPDAVQVNVVAKQWMWKLQQPEGKAEINTLHLAVGRPVQLRMISEDVIHSLYIPAFRSKMDVLPGRYTYQWFRPTKVGEYHLFCAEYCGTSHSGMIGRVIVQEPTEFAEWLRGSARVPPEEAGARLFEQYQCNTCHRNAPDARCPPLEGLYGRKVALQDGRTVVADDNYLRESIVDPGAKVVAGYKPVMPTFKTQLGEEQLLQLLAYIRSLGPQGPAPKQPTAP
jgi:cytochrome c oxidase subunit 2